jgi:hypothetical protein
VDGFGHELRLLLAVLLNAAVWGCAYRFARRRGDGGALQAVCDAFLLSFTIQYAAVALPGVVGLLNVWTMSAVALSAAGGLLWLSMRGGPGGAEPPPIRWDAGRLTLLGCGLFVTAYVLAHAHANRWDPPRATDTLVYHLPAAVQWLQTGRLGLFPTWYWNPANAWSPMTGSTFIAWLMAPLGNDVLARFVQGPALLFLFALLARLGRIMGCGPAVAGLLAAAAVVSRPLFSQVGFAKDDLFVAAFFVAAVVSMSRDNLRHRLGPLRVGLAIGLLLAMKYTVVLVCPLLLFLLDAPFRAGWRARQWVVAIVVALVLSVPWFARNALLTGNPFYPMDVSLLGVEVFHGLFTTARAQDVRHASGVMRVLFDDYHSLPPPLAVTLLLGCLVGIAAAGGSVLRDPPRRAVLLGTPLTLASLFLTLPNQEVRFAFPLFALLFPSVAPALARWGRPAPVGILLAAGLLVLSLATSTSPDLWRRVAGMALPPLVIAVLAAGAWAVQTHYLRLRAQSLALVGALAALGCVMFVYVEWSAYTEAYGLGVPARSAEAYPAEAPLWTFVREHVPDDATLAVANTYWVYPFYDAGLRRRVVYAPVRPDVSDYRGLPRLGDEPIPADLLAERTTRVMNAGADRAAWLEHLGRSGAQFLVIARSPHESNPPEDRFVAEEPGRFEKLFDHPLGGAVYRIAGAAPPAAGAQPPSSP